MEKNEIIKSFQNVLSLEAKALQNLSNSLSLSAESAHSTVFLILQDIHASKGKIICCGIGKSALIAQKMVATFNSTGSPAAFLHAAEGLHGDLGMIQKEDRVILLSKSGNTPEIKMILPHLQKLATKIYGITANKDSFLATHCNAIIHTPMDTEACPNNLAPTTSTTLQLAVGDALAVCLMQMRGFSAEQFGLYHPGGALGKQLFLTAQELLRKERPFVLENAPLQEVILTISTNRLGATAVLDGKEKLVGLITDGDLRRMLQKHDSAKWGKLTARDILFSFPKTIDIHGLASEALAIFEQYKINQLVVMQGQVYKGILHWNDVMGNYF